MLIFGNKLIGGIGVWLWWSVLNGFLCVVIGILGCSFMGSVGEMIDFDLFMISMDLGKVVLMVSEK